jgi:hypothetical protein
MSVNIRTPPRLPIAGGGRRLLLVPPDGKTINTYLPLELLRKIFLYCMQSNFMESGTLVSVCRYWRLVITRVKTINTYLPMGLLREIFLYSMQSNQMKPRPLVSVCRYWRFVITTIKTINTYLPMELLREIFLYSIESNEMKSGQLASVCRYWRSVISSIAHLWSTLRVGTWTETEHVTTWLQRAYPKKVIIDPQRDSQRPSEAPMFAALQNSLTSTSQWNELTISSFPAEHLASQLGVQVASPMNVLKVLHVAAGCVDSSSFALLLNLVPTEAPLCELRLHSPFASTHFLQPHWFPVLKNLTVLIVNGRNIHESFELLPTFIQLQTFEADHLRLPFYEPNVNLPLLRTLRKLQLRACSVQWMAGRQFPYLEECAILLPHHWKVIQMHEVQLPSCKKLAYHGYPMTTAQYFRVPEMRAVDLRSDDCNEQRVCQHLRHLFRVNRRVSNLTTLHITLQCSEQVLVKVLKRLVLLQELVLSIALPSPSWQSFLESLAAKPSANEWPVWSREVVFNHQWEQWKQWCSSQTWNANILPHLKCLGIQCPKGFYQSERLENLPLLRLVGWTRAHLTPPLEHLNVWEGRGTMCDIVVDYISTGYLNKHLGVSEYEQGYDAGIVMAMVTGHLVIGKYTPPILQLHSTTLFRQLQHLDLTCPYHLEILILPYLEQIKELEISGGIIHKYPLNIDLPLTHTLQCLELHRSTFSWMLGRTFKALREFQNDRSPFVPENLSMDEGLQIDLPTCTTLQLDDHSMGYLHTLSCSNVQNLHWRQALLWTTPDETALNSLHDFVITLSCLQQLYIELFWGWAMDPLIRLVFCGASEQGAWRDIRCVEVKIWFRTSSEASQFFDQRVEHQQRYGKSWRTFTVTKERDFLSHVKVDASM